MNAHATSSQRKNKNTSKKQGQHLRFIVISLALCALLVPSLAQTENTNSSVDNFDIDLELKNMHLWHGSIVTPGGMMASSLEFTSTNNKFVAGLWGGASFNGNYKEFSYYSTYRFKDNFNISLISHNNYSNSVNPDIFSYDKITSPNFLDIVFEYTVSEELPLTIYWSTILFGQGADYETASDGTVTDSYSTYTELRYQLLPKQKTQLTLFAGGAFSFTTEKTFYSKSPNIVNFGVSASRNINLLAKDFPVSATAFWNPESKLGALQLAISLF